MEWFVPLPDKANGGTIWVNPRFLTDIFDVGIPPNTCRVQVLGWKDTVGIALSALDVIARIGADTKGDWE